MADDAPPDPQPTPSINKVERVPHIGPQDRPPTVATPEPESTTPLLPIDDEANFVYRPDIARLSNDISQGKFPAEPHMVVLPHKSTDETLRDLARFAIISRMLFRNHKNAEILAQLSEAGHLMSEPTLRRLMRRSDFHDYYEKYRNQLMDPLDKQVRDDFKLAMPEAFTTLIKVMRTARNDKTKMEAAVTILEGGGGLKKDRADKKFVFNVPAELQKAMFEAGSKIMGGFPRGDDDPDRIN
jgi:hypothetical protein